jgi:hypothetical protein
MGGGEREVEKGRWRKGGEGCEVKEGRLRMGGGEREVEEWRWRKGSRGREVEKGR